MIVPPRQACESGDDSPFHISPVILCSLQVSALIFPMTRECAMHILVSTTTSGDSVVTSPTTTSSLSQPSPSQHQKIYLREVPLGEERRYRAKGGGGERSEPGEDLARPVDMSLEMR